MQEKQESSASPAFSDWMHWNMCQGQEMAYANTCQDTCPPAGVTPKARHNEGSNVAFADGHAKWMQATAILGMINLGANNTLWLPLAP